MCQIAMIITLTLTAIANVAAQSLYEAHGYTKDEEFYHYALRL
jgi:ribosomal protein S18 acetylase RimI-like enzyme